jgi:hypothetical protein
MLVETLYSFFWFPCFFSWKSNLLKTHFIGFPTFLMKYSNLLKTHFVVGASDIVGNQFKFVGLPAVMLRKGLNFVAARFACYCMFFGQDW